MVLIPLLPTALFLFFFNDTATTEIYTLSLHDALPISGEWDRSKHHVRVPNGPLVGLLGSHRPADRKSTRLNSSHSQISYAVFCLKKKSSTIPRPAAPGDSQNATATPARASLPAVPSLS